MSNSAGKVVLVWGGSGGIGFATANALKRRGCEPFLVARDPERLAAAAGELGCGFAVADALDPQALSRATHDAAARTGHLAGLVYAIGSITLKPFARLTAEDFTRDFALNASGAAQAIQAALPALKAAPATPSVVLFSTIAVAQGFTSHASIAMAKGAVEGLTLSLAAELAPAIRVNCVAPSLTRTPLARALTANEQMAGAIAALHPLQRLGTPEDAGNLAAFLVSDEAGWITGQVMHVDGGRSTLRTKG
jgi:NAD(P)-dependent dehydrogenase (short-subunit alcohol dehydrogenase family)